MRLEIAERLGMTVREMDSRMSAREYMDWMFYVSGTQSVEDMIGEVEQWRQSVISS